MNERLIFRYPSKMAINWTVRMLLALLFLAATAVYAIQFTPARGLLLLVAIIITIPTVIYGVYSLLLLSVTIMLGETAVSIRSPINHRRIPYGEIEEVQVKWGRVLLVMGDGVVGINGRFSHRSRFLRTLRQRSPHISTHPASIRLSVKPSYLGVSIFSAIILLIAGVGSLVSAIPSGEIGAILMMVTVGLIMLVLDGFIWHNLALLMMYSIQFSREQIVRRTLFHHHAYDATQLREIRLETVYYTYKNSRQSRLELSLTFKTEDELRIQQGWVAQAFPDFLLLLDDMYPIAPTENKSTEVIPHERFGTGSDQPFSTYFEQESGVQVHSIQDIQTWLKGCRYLSDPEQFGKEDHWLHPVEFEATRKGDCEDHALWAWRKLVDLGFKAEFVTGHHNTEGMEHEALPPVNHAWVTFWENGRLYLMETTSKSDMKRPFASTARTHQPRYSVDETFITFRHDLPKKEAGH